MRLFTFHRWEIQGKERLYWLKDAQFISEKFGFQLTHSNSSALSSFLLVCTTILFIHSMLFSWVLSLLHYLLFLYRNPCIHSWFSFKKYTNWIISSNSMDFSKIFVLFCKSSLKIFVSIYIFIRNALNWTFKNPQQLR